MKELVKELMQAGSCCAELKEVAAKWLEAEGTDKEAEATAKLVKELKEDIMPIDVLLEFIASPMAEEIFGADRQKAILQHAREIEAAGAKYCDCPACAAGLKILEKFGAH